MAIQVTNGISVAGAGLSMQSSVVRSGSASIGLEESLAAAKTGTVTTRTDDDTGELTLEASHGIVDADVIDVYWSGGVQYNCTVGTVATNVVPIDAGSGDVLPSTSTAVTAVKIETANIYIDGDNAKLIAVVLKTADTTLRTAGHVAFFDSGDNEIAEIDLVANIPQIWDIEGGSANPFTGNPITYAQLSQANSSVAGTLVVIGVYDAVA